MSVLASSSTRIVTRGIWFGDEDRPGFGWLSRPEADLGRSIGSGVVIAPPVGYPYWGSHRTLRVIAEQLAERGHAVLRIDYDGTGDAAGDQWDPDRVQAWRATLGVAAAQLRAMGASTLTVIGVRLGATLALLDGATVGADRMVVWQPIDAGRRYAKELRLLSQPVPEAADPLQPAGTRLLAGSVFSAQTLEDLRRLSLADISAAPAPTVLIVDGVQGSSESTVARLRSLGADVKHLELGGGEQALELAPEYATVPASIVDAVVGWMGEATEQSGTTTGPALPPGAAPDEPRGRATMRWRSGWVDEEAITLAPHGHVGILCGPSGEAAIGATMVLLNPGSETHVGPGRAWVEIARDLALAGRRTVRVDFLGWGESPDTGHAPGRPYDQHGVADCAAIVQELRSAGHERIVVLGLCASAWIVLAAARQGGMDGVIALNPQLYWQPGDIVEIDWDVIRATRGAEIRRIEQGARFGVWRLLAALGQRPRVVRWLQAVSAAVPSTYLLFAAEDDGLKYLRERLSGHLSRLQSDGSLTIAELADVDHPLHRTWLRPRLVATLLETLRAIDAKRQPSG